MWQKESRIHNNLRTFWLAVRKIKAVSRLSLPKIPGGIVFWIKNLIFVTYESTLFC